MLGKPSYRAGPESEQGSSQHSLHRAQHFCPNSTNSNKLLAGANYYTLYTIAVLDLNNGPEILSVPAMSGKYYDIELVNLRGYDFLRW